MFNEKLFAKKLSGLVPYKVDTNKYKARLDANESFINLPESVRNEYVRALRSASFNRYPDPDANELCMAFAKFFDIDRKCVVAGNGSDEIISVIMNGFADKGSAVMTFSPDFSMYDFYAEISELKLVKCEKSEATLQIDFALADALIKKNDVKICIFSNPCNPTGRNEKKKDIAEIAANNPETLFVVDEAYMDFAGDGKSESFLKDVCKYPNIIVLKTLSKAIGAASLRLGFVVADEVFCNMFSAVKSPYNVNSISQLFGKELLRNKDMLEECVERIICSRDELYNSISELKLGKLSKMYSNFVFLECENAKKIYETLKKNGILVRYFPIGNGALRITAGAPNENKMLVDILKNM